jgi:hypothetical protein
VRNEGGAPLPFANVAVPSLGVGAQTNAQGRYSFVVPGARALGRTVAIEARLVGFRVGPGGGHPHGGRHDLADFTLVTNPLRLSEVVVTGSGTSTTREKLGTAVSSVASATSARAAR